MKKAALFIFILFACAKINNPSQFTPTLLEGHWRFIKSVVSWPDQSINYTSEIEMLIFQGNVLNIYYADSTQKSMYFTLEYNIINATDTVFYLTYDDAKYAMKIDSDTLILSLAHLDGPADFYLKSPYIR